MRRWDAQGNVIQESAAPAGAPARPRPRQLRSIEQRLEDPNEDVAQQARVQSRTVRRWDAEGNPLAAAPYTAEETRDDVARSGVTGVQRGVSGLFGTAGDYPDIIEGVSQWAGSLVDADPAVIHATVESARDTLGGVFPALRSPGGGAASAMQYPQSADVSEAITSRVPEEYRDWVTHEPQTTAGEYARTVGEFVPNAALGPGGALTRTARVVVPALASETAGQLTEDTPLEGPARFVTALVSGGVNEGVITVLRRGGRTPDERALRLILRELNDQGMSTEEIVRQANQLLRQAPTEEVLLETLGAGGLRLARAVANMGRGAGRSTAEETLSARAEGRPRIRANGNTVGRPAITSVRDRILDEATRTTAPSQTRAPRNYWDALDALRRARGAQGADAYRGAYTATPDPVAVQDHLLPYMAQAPREASASGARQLGSVADGLRANLARARQRGAQAAEIDAIQAELDDVTTAMNQLDGLARGTTPNTLNTRAIDYFQRGLSQMERTAGIGSPEARAIGESRRSFNDMVDDMVPEFGDARGRYGESMRIEEYMGHGRRVFDMPEGEIDRLMRGADGSGLSVEEFDGFMLGVMDSIEHKLGQSDTGFLARLMRNQNWRDQLTTAVGGEPNARRFLNRLAREANMQQTRNYVVRGNSQTTPIAEDIAALTQGEQELAFMNDNARQLIANGGQLRPLVTRWVLGWFDRFNRPGLRDPQVQEALARRLFTRVNRESAVELRDALNAARTDPELPADVRAWLARVTAANAATDDPPNEDDGAGGGARAEYLDLRRQAEGEAAPAAAN